MTSLLLTGLLAFAETPEKTIQDFLAAFNARDSAGMGRQVVGAPKGANPFIASIPPDAKITATLGEVKIDGDTAKVEADVEASGSLPKAAHETVELRRLDGDWQIVPVDPEKGGMREAQFVGFLAYMVLHPEVMARARQAAKKTQCLSNVKQLGLATIMYSLDHDDVLPKTSAGWKAAIMPYAKNEQIFHCPDDTSGAVSYFLDPRVAGMSTTRIAQPAATAMVVEGTTKKTAFRHGGSAMIAFTDGHAKALKAPALLKARTVSLR